MIAGLDPGPHVLRVEPLDDGDIESFFDSTLNIVVDFRAQFYARIVVVPKGGGTSGVEPQGGGEVMACVRPFRTPVGRAALCLTICMGRLSGYGNSSGLMAWTSGTRPSLK